MVASLAGGDEVDATNVSFLLRKTLVLKKERRRKLEEEEEQEHFLEQSMRELRLLAPADEEDDGAPQAP